MPGKSRLSAKKKERNVGPKIHLSLKCDKDLVCCLQTRFVNHCLWSMVTATTGQSCLQILIHTASRQQSTASTSAPLMCYHGPLSSTHPLSPSKNSQCVSQAAPYEAQSHNDWHNGLKDLDAQCTRTVKIWRPPRLTCN